MSLAQHVRAPLELLPWRAFANWFVRTACRCVVVRPAAILSLHTSFPSITPLFNSRHQTRLARLFTTPDEYHLLSFRATVARIRSLLKAKGMNVLDAFRAFDFANNGQLSCSELYGGLDWLGLQVTPAQIYEIVRVLDKESTGTVSFDEFRAAFHDPADPLTDMDTSAAAGGAAATAGDDSAFVAPGTVPPKQIREINQELEEAKGEEEAAAREIPPSVLKNFKFKLQKVAGWKRVWTSRGTMARVKVSMWQPDSKTSGLSKNRLRVCLGHYVAPGYAAPKKAKGSKGLASQPMILEITDQKSTGLGGSSYLTHVVDKFLPKALRFRLIWSLVTGKEPLYVWGAEAPSEEFVALGVVATNSPTPPHRSSLRCVPRSWVTECPDEPRKIWDESGADASRAASFWVTEKLLSIVSVVADHSPPRASASFQLRYPRWMLDETGAPVV